MDPTRVTLEVVNRRGEVFRLDSATDDELAARWLWHIVKTKAVAEHAASPAVFDLRVHAR